MILLLPGVPSPASRTLCIFIYYFHFCRIYFRTLISPYTSVSDSFLYFFLLFMYVSYTKILGQSVTKSPYFPVLLYFPQPGSGTQTPLRTQAEYQPPGISVFCASGQHSKLSQNFICSFIPVYRKKLTDVFTPVEI